MADNIAEDLRKEYEELEQLLMMDGFDSAKEEIKNQKGFIERISRAEARIAELKAENKLLREHSDAMALILERASSVLTGGCDCWYWPEMKIAAGKYRSAFPREEAKHGG